MRLTEYFFRPYRSSKEQLLGNILTILAIFQVKLTPSHKIERGILNYTKKMVGQCSWYFIHNVNGNFKRDLTTKPEG